MKTAEETSRFLHEGNFVRRLCLGARDYERIIAIGGAHVTRARELGVASRYCWSRMASKAQADRESGFSLSKEQKQKVRVYASEQPSGSEC